MGEFLLKLLELSLWAGILTIVVLGIRLLFRKIPAKYLCVLWMIVAARLVLPFSLETSFAPLRSLGEYTAMLPGTGEVHGTMTEYHVETYFPGTAVNSEKEYPAGTDTLGLVPGTDTNVETDYYLGEGGTSVTIPIVEEAEEVDYYITSEITGETQQENGNAGRVMTAKGPNDIHIVPEYVPVVAVVWLTGVVLLMAYGGLSCVKVKRMVKNSILYKDNVWLCEGLESPFLFGWVHPKIYLPMNLEEVQIQYVIEHEKAHIARGDHFAKLAGYVLLSVYWFNPLLWVAYLMFCKDVERACDEWVIAGYGVEDRKGYAEALLECSAGCGFAISHPLAFGEMDVKKRIGGILMYQKPGKWLAAVAVILCVVAVAGCFMVQKEENGQDNQKSSQLEVSPTMQLTIPPAEVTPTVGPSSEERGNGPTAPTPTILAAAPTAAPTIFAGTPTPLPPSDLELLGKTTPESVIAVPMGQTILVDLNGDGTEESVTFGIKGYEGNVSVKDIVDSIRYTWDEFEDFYFLKINDTVFTKDEIAMEYWNDSAGTTTYYIFDIDVTDKYKEIGLCFNGPSNDPTTGFYRYVDGDLFCVGAIGDTPMKSDYHWYEYGYEYQKMPYDEMVEKVDREEYQITVLGDGNILLRERVDVLETNSSVREYNLWNSTSSWGATLKETIRERYEFTGWDYDCEEMNSRTKKDLIAYRDQFDIMSRQDTASTVFIPEGTRMSIYSYYPDNGWTAGWIQFAYGENLESFAWFYKGVDPKGKLLLYFPEETVNWPDDVFENLNHAD